MRKRGQIEKKTGFQNEKSSRKEKERSNVKNQKRKWMKGSIIQIW